MNWTVIVAKAARKQLAGLPVKDQEKIGAALRQMALDPFTGDVLKLVGQNNRWRRRIGNYRIFFAIDDATRTIGVSAIQRRTSTTY